MKQLVLIALLSTLMAPTCNKDVSNEGGGNSTANSGTTTSHQGSRVPINGGIAFLVIGGVVFGLYKLKNRKIDQIPS